MARVRSIIQVFSFVTIFGILVGCSPKIIGPTELPIASCSSADPVADLGALDPTLVWSSGYYSSANQSTLPASKVCSGNLIFGVAGTALCDSRFGDLVASNVFRNVGTSQITYSAEKAATSYPMGYRDVADIKKDDEGQWDPANGCTGAGGNSNTCTSIIKAAAPSTPCGSSQASIEDRIADCASKNGAAATWDPAAKGTAGEATWKLVTFKGGYEVWRDERTQLLWSDSNGTYTNWCKATGNKQADDPDNTCNNATYQDQTNPYSACAEFTDAQAFFAGDNYGTGVYSDIKGGLGKLSSPSVKWRVPSRADWLQAEVDGLRSVLPKFARDSSFYDYWMATVLSSYRKQAWYIDSYAQIRYDFSNRWGNNHMVRCVGQ